MLGRRQHIGPVKGVGVQEIGLARFDQRMRHGGDDIVPPHMRHLGARVGRGQVPHRPAHPAEPGVNPMFFARIRHQLHPDANAEEGHGIPPHASLQRLDHAGHAAQSARARPECANAGEDDTVGGGDRGGIGGDQHVGGTRRLQRIGDRMQIPRAIIDEGEGHAVIVTPAKAGVFVGLGHRARHGDPSLRWGDGVGELSITTPPWCSESRPPCADRARPLREARARRP